MVGNKIKTEFVVLEGNSVEITSKLNEILDALQEAGAVIKDIKVNYTKEHGFDGFLVAYTIVMEVPKEMELEA
ncbi:MAG: hypothetical protein GXN97_05580 [Aquificae bacterium]|jgi:hypothetical protein|nr:hypothetical protein [Aquificota bacterium]